MGVGSFSLPINAPFSQYENPSDWVDITNVPNNEIYLLTSDIEFASVSFTVTTSTGTYNVDWGDGNSTTGITSNTNTSYIYTYGSGLTGTTYPGITTFRCRIYATSGTITRFFITPNTSIVSFQTQSILSANFGTTGLTSMANAFFHSTTGTTATNLRSVYLPTNLNSCTTMVSAFQNCVSLVRVDMPVSMTSCTTFVNCFSTCRSLNYLKLPTTYGVNFTMQSIAPTCTSLYRVDFPTTMNFLTNIRDGFAGCTALEQVNLPISATGCTNWFATFNSCLSLQQIRWIVNGNSAYSMEQTFTGCLSLLSFTMVSTANGVRPLTDTFNGCTSLQTVFFPSSLPNINNVNRTFQNCRALISVQMPTSINNSFPNVNCANIFENCNSLQSINVSAFTISNNWSSAFSGCSSLRTITGSQNIGSSISTNTLQAGGFLVGNQNFTGTLTMGGRFAGFSCNGTISLPQKITGVRLLNQTTLGSPWTGGSPQIDVSYNNIGQSALVNLFNDLNTVTAKTINITGNPGAALLTPAERAIATGKGWTITG